MEAITYEYVRPFGLPLRWQDETSGVLPSAVNAYLKNRTEGLPFSTEQCEVVLAYLCHYIDAPCWDCQAEAQWVSAALSSLRRDVRLLKSATDISEWIERCMDVGVDPL